MKPAQIFHQYIWIINTFRVFGQLTLEELNEKWVEDKVTEGNALPRSSFNRHRDAIRDMFGIDIECDKMTYKYYIGNLGVLGDGSIEQWLFSTMAVHGVLADSAAVKDRVVLENVPAGEEFLETIIRAIKAGKKVLMTHQRLGRFQSSPASSASVPAARAKPHTGGARRTYWSEESPNIKA